MTEAQANEPKEIRRGTIFGREAINRNDLLKALVVDGQDKVRLDDIQNYVNKSQKQAQHLGWYKFAALFGFIIIILQALTTFGVVLWGDGVTRQLYEQDGVMMSSTGVPIDVMGDKSVTPDTSGNAITVDYIFKALSVGVPIGRVSGLALEDSDGNHVEFNLEFGGSSFDGNAFALYATTGAVINVTETSLTLTIGENTYSETESTRRRMSVTKKQCAALSLNDGDCVKLYYYCNKEISNGYSFRIGECTGASGSNKGECESAGGSWAGQTYPDGFGDLSKYSFCAYSEST